jgi:TolB-like protein/class 3 adenylate cyclase/Flp pilus assembly protein TadD
MSQTHQLAAIMFTDIVGYTALMGDDEQKAFQILATNRELQKPIIEKHNGRWIKEIGDGILASFNSVSDAVYAAGELQKQCNEAGAYLLRIGIHEGEIVLDGNDVFGDAVNIASRIQSVAPPGSIAISETVYRNVVNKPGIRTRYIKTEKLKNVKAPVKIYEVVPDSAAKTFLPVKKSDKILVWKVLILFAALFLLSAAGYFVYNAVRTKTTSSKAALWERSIAVLPFVNISNDKEQEYFSDGLTEELLNLLAKTPGLKVIARSSAFAFKGKNEDARTIGKKLGVDHILEGSVQKSGNQIRIKAFLVKTSDGKQIWTDTYDRQFTDIFKVQDEIASAVVSQLKLKFFGSGTSNTSKPEVLNLILQGNYFLEKLTKTDVFKAFEFYEEARKVDSTDARVWASIGSAYSIAAWQNYINQSEGYEKTRQAAMKAISLEPTSTAALIVLGNVKLFFEFDWEGAKDAFNKALSIEPSNASAQHMLGAVNQILGNRDEAIQQGQIAILLDPLRPTAYIMLAAGYTNSNRLDEANAVYKKLLEMYPMFQRVHMYLGRNYLLQGKYQAALEEMQKENTEVFKHFGLVLAWQALNNRKESDSLMASFVEKYQDSWAYLIAELHAFRGEREEAVEWLQKALQRRDTWITWIKGDPLLKSIWNHPGYIDVLKKMNLQ